MRRNRAAANQFEEIIGPEKSTEISEYLWILF